MIWPKSVSWTGSKSQNSNLESQIWTMSQKISLNTLFVFFGLNLFLFYLFLKKFIWVFMCLNQILKQNWTEVYFGDPSQRIKTCSINVLETVLEITVWYSVEQSQLRTVLNPKHSAHLSFTIVRISIVQIAFFNFELFLSGAKYMNKHVQIEINYVVWNFAALKQFVVVHLFYFSVTNFTFSWNKFGLLVKTFIEHSVLLNLQ